MDEVGYIYEYVIGDDFKMCIYILDNGLKIYISVYKNVLCIQIFIFVKVGGKFDLVNFIGLVYYLEYMMFKGIDVFGIKDWEKERVFVDSIEQMFEYYCILIDLEECKVWYVKIDVVFKEVFQYVIVNEYDWMIGLIGVKGMNVYMIDDCIVYMNDIFFNQLENFFKIEVNCFGKIVNCLFYIELEVVYEEKN